jgi:hypothetical protein
MKMKVRKRKLERDDDLGLDWEKWADGRAQRLKRKRDFGDIDPGLAIEAAQNAAARMGKGVQAVRDRHFPLKYIWVQFCDGKLKAGQPCPCGSRRLLRLHTKFVKCPQCGSIFLQGKPGEADFVDSRPAVRLRQITGLRLAQLMRTDDGVDIYRGYGENQDGGPVLVLAGFRVIDNADAELNVESALERVDSVTTVPLDQVSDLLDTAPFTDGSRTHWDLVF